MMKKCSVNSPAVLVTGSRGYIGSAVVPKLLEKGCTVCGADTGWFLDEKYANDFSKLTIDYLRGFDAVIHLAGLSDDKLCDAFPEKAIDINVRETVSFAMRCKQAGVSRFVLASSAAVYGNTTDIASEDHPLNPETVYSKSKVEAEHRLLELITTEFNVVCLRFGSAYGYSAEPRVDLVLNRLANRAINEGEIGLFSDGLSYRPFVHVEDVAAAITHTVTCADVTRNHQIFNVSHPQGNLTVGKSIEILAEVSGATLLQPHSIKDPRSYTVNVDRLIETGFAYQWPLEKGLDHLVRELKYLSSSKPEQDRIQKLSEVFGQSHTKKDQIASVSPSVLNEKTTKHYLADVSSIVKHSRYRLAGQQSCRAAELLQQEYQTSDNQQALMFRSGTDALTRALQVLGVKAGSSVAMPDQCFHAVATSVLSLGAHPVLIDTCSDDFNLDSKALQAFLSNNSVDCVIAVDNYGTPADWAAISAVARAHGTPLIVDACESLGASRKTQQVVDHADIVVVSFSFTKPIHAAGMGGALIADRSITQIIESNEAYLYRQLRLPEINAAYLVRAWDELHTNINHLRDIYSSYSEVVQQFDFVPQKEYGRSTRIHAPFLIPARWSAKEKKTLIEKLARKGVQVAEQFQCQSNLLSLNSNCRVSKDTANRVVTLPTGGGLQNQSIRKVQDSFSTCVDKILNSSIYNAAVATPAVQTEVLLPN